jgi:hypothetical protein
VPLTTAPKVTIVTPFGRVMTARLPMRSTEHPSISPEMLLGDSGSGDEEFD